MKLWNPLVHSSLNQQQTHPTKELPTDELGDPIGNMDYRLTATSQLQDNTSPGEFVTAFHLKLRPYPLRAYKAMLIKVWKKLHGHL